MGAWVLDGRQKERNDGIKEGRQDSMNEKNN